MQQELMKLNELATQLLSFKAELAGIDATVEENKALLDLFNRVETMQNKIEIALTKEDADIEKNTKEENKPIYVKEISLEDKRLKGFIDKFSIALEIKEKLDINTLTNDVRFWCQSNCPSQFNGKEPTNIAVVGPGYSGYKALFKVMFAEVTPHVVAPWQEKVSLSENISVDWPIGIVEVINSATNSPCYTSESNNVINFKETFSLEHGDYFIIVTGHNGVGPDAKLTKRFPKFQVRTSTEAEFTINVTGKMPLGLSYSFSPTWFGGKLEIVNSSGKIVTEKHLDRKAKGTINETIKSPITGALTLRLTGFDGLNFRTDWVEERQIIVQNTNQKITVSVKQPILTPIKLSINPNWIVGRVELVSDKGYVTAQEMLLSQISGSINLEFNAYYPGKFKIRCVRHTGFTFLDSEVHETEFELHNSLAPIIITLTQPNLPLVKVDMNTSFLVGKLEILTEGKVLEKDLILTNNESLTIPTRPKLIDDLLPMMPGIGMVPEILSNAGFKIRLYAFDAELGFSIPNQYEESEIIHLLHLAQNMQLSWETKIDAKRDFKKEVSMEIDFQIINLEWLTPAGKLFERMDTVFMNTSGVNRFYKICEQSGEYMVVATGFKRKEGEHETAATKKLKVKMEKGDVLEVILSVSPEANLGGLSVRKTREQEFANAIIDAYSSKIDDVINALQTHKFDQQFVNDIPKQEKFDVLLVVDFVSALMSLNPANPAGPALAAIKAGIVLLSNIIQSSMSQFKGVQTVQEYYNEHINVWRKFKEQVKANEIYKRVVLNEKPAEDDPRRPTTDPLISSNLDYQQAMKELNSALNSYPAFADKNLITKQVFVGWIKRYGIKNGKKDLVLSYALKMYRNYRKDDSLWQLSRQGNINIIPKVNGLKQVLIDLEINSLSDSIFQHEVNVIIKYDYTTHVHNEKIELQGEARATAKKINNMWQFKITEFDLLSDTKLYPSVQDFESVLKDNIDNLLAFNAIDF